MPRPCVAAISALPSGENVRSFTDAFGRPVPKRDHVVEPTAAENTPTSVARYIVLPFSTRSSPGASGRLPLMSVHVAPPFVDLKTWPVPPEGIHCREKPPKTAYTVAALLGSTVSEDT